MSLFDTKENQVLDWLFGSGSPASFDLGVSKTQPADDGTNISEPSPPNNYSRVTITNNVTNFPNASGGTKTNGVAFQFPQASGSWGTALGWWVLYDGVTPVMWGTLTPAKVIDNGDILRIPSGQMTLTCD